LAAPSIRGTDLPIVVAAIWRLAPGTEERLPAERIRQWLQRIRPLARVDLAPLRLRAHAAVPADLLHIVVELDAVAFRVEAVGRVVDAWIELRWDQIRLDPHAVLTHEADSILQLLVVRNLDAE